LPHWTLVLNLKNWDATFIVQANKQIESEHTSTALLETLVSVQTQNSLLVFLFLGMTLLVLVIDLAGILLLMLSASRTRTSIFVKVWL
jgi:hypothetical protein